MLRLIRIQYKCIDLGQKGWDRNIRWPRLTRNIINIRPNTPTSGSFAVNRRSENEQKQINKNSQNEQNNCQVCHSPTEMLNFKHYFMLIIVLL